MTSPACSAICRTSSPTLLNNPDNAPQQSQVVQSAITLAQGINTLSDAYTAQRQTAEDNIVTEVATLNATLGTIGELSNKIVALKAGGQSTADLENQRDAALATSLATCRHQGAGAAERRPADRHHRRPACCRSVARTNPFTTAGANVQPDAYYPDGGIEGIMLGGNDVTSQLRGGQIGANIALRDTTLPTDQAELDEFAQNLASPVQRLRPDAIHRAGRNAADEYAAAGAERLCRLCRHHPGQSRRCSPIHRWCATATSAPTPARAGYTDIIKAVLNYDVGSNPPLAVHRRGLGPAGNLNAPYVSPPSTLGQLAATMLASQAQESAATTTQADTEQAVQTTLASKLSAQSGVNMDTEMSHMIQLQNAYGANARDHRRDTVDVDASSCRRCDEEHAMSGSITMTGVTGYATLTRLIQDSEATHAGSTTSPTR